VLRNQLVQIALLDGAQVLYLAVFEGRQRFPMSASVGDRYPASVTAVGTALLSELTPSQVAELYWDTSNLVGFTKKSTSTLAELQDKLERPANAGTPSTKVKSTRPCSDWPSPSREAPVSPRLRSASRSSTPPAPTTSATPS